MILFQGSSLDIYIHWLILLLGIGILISGISVITTSRSFAGFFHLLKDNGSLKTRIYSAYFRFHSYYWYAFGMFLVLHLLVTIYHLGLPSPDKPYYLAQQISFYTAITNLVLSGIVFTSCKSFPSFVMFFTSRNPLSGRVFARFYKFHSIFWWLFAVSLITHIVAGIIHAVNT
jgi:cytochrome b561